MQIYIKKVFIAVKMVIQCTRINKKRENKRKNKQKGYGLIDYIINKLPEIHIPGYQFCGPGTDLKTRLARGDPGINPLDQACKDHDIFYSKVNSSKDRRKADKALVARAFPRVYSRDAKMGERAAALLTTGLMGAKIGLSKIGLGLKNSKLERKKTKSLRAKAVGNKKRAKVVKKKTVNKKRAKGKKKKQLKKKARKSISFSKLVQGVKKKIKRSTLESSSLGNTVTAAIRRAKDLKRNKSTKVGRILKLPKFGGNVLPIVPILSALSAVGTIPASTVAVIETIKKIYQTVHNSSGKTQKKIGRGLYLMSDAKGAGFYLRPYRHH